MKSHKALKYTFVKSWGKSIKGKSGWWKQIQNNDFAETKTNYGDSNAVSWRPNSAQFSEQISEAPKQLELKDPKSIWVSVSKKTLKSIRESKSIKEPVSIKEPKSIKEPVIKTRHDTSADIERDLLRKNLDFYRSLEKGGRTPTTSAQKHFVEVCRGDLKPKTIHEEVYLRYIKNRDIKRK